MKTAKYNPGFLTDDELVASFCVRTHEFASIIEMLRECDGSSNPHRLVIGPRGCGKTSLLLRVAAEIRRDPALSSSFFPIVFAEESYEVATAGEFWLEALSRLAYQVPCPGGKDDLHLTVEELRKTPDTPGDQMLGKRCLGSLLDFSDRQGKRLILIVENLNMMFRDMSDRDAGWQLRQVLQTEPRLIWLASATARFDEINKPDRAFYDLFVSQTLRPLCTEECAVLWEHVSGQHRSPETMRGLRILTGGSPRLLSIVARFGAGLSFRDLMADLMELIDDLTEYFKSHIDMLAPQERRVYLALADLWEPASAREVATQARLDTSQCSAQLRRLIERGVVEAVGGGPRRKQYYLTERLYNIYYLLRRSRTPTPLFEALIRFMDAYYSPLQLTDWVSRMIQEANELEPKIKPFHWAALAGLVSLPGLASYREELLSTVPERHVTQREGPMPAEIPIKKGSVMAGENQKKDIDAIIRSILKRLKTDDSLSVRIEAAKKIIKEGVSFQEMGQPEATFVACTAVVRQFSDSDAPQLAEQVAKALFLKGVTLGKSKRYDEELVSHDEVVHRFGDSKMPAVLQVVAWTLITKVLALKNLGRFDEAIIVCDEIVHLFGDNKTSEILVVVAHALANKGDMLMDLNRPEEAVAVYDETLRRFVDSKKSVMLEAVARVLVNKGIALVGLDQSEEAIAVCDQVEQRFDGKDALQFRAQIARMFICKGLALSILNQEQKAKAAWQEVIQRFEASDHPAFRHPVATALLRLADSARKQNCLDEAINTVDLLFSRDGEQAYGCRCEGHLIRSRAYLASNKFSQARQDVEAALELLPNCGFLLREALETLIDFTVSQGAADTNDLVQFSPSAKLLTPLAVALDKEMGREPKVAREIEEVAEDICKDIRKVREREGLISV